MTYQEFLKLVTDVLGKEFIEKTEGYTLHSHFDTIREGNLYIIGLNPGKDPENPNKKLMTIGESLRQINRINGYVGCEDKWDTLKKKYEKGQHPIQRNIKQIAKVFSESELYSNLKLVEDGEDKSYKNVCLTNLIFESSDNEHSVKYSERDTYWKIHKQILKIIKPKIIIAFGNSETSPYQHLKNIAQELQEEKQEDIPESGHGKLYKCKSFTGKIEGRDTTVIGLPHLSIYSLWTENDKKKCVLNWMVEKC